MAQSGFLHLPVLIRFLPLLALGGLVACAPSVTRTSGVDDEAQLPYWEMANEALSIRLVQRLPDQTRGFFQARGFSVEDSETIAQNCVFQTVFRNRSSAQGPVMIEYDLMEWTIHTDGAESRLKTREHWKKVWAGRNAPLAAQLALEWGLLPTRQAYGPGDYNWGLTLYGLPHGVRFDLDIVWRQNGERRSARLKQVQCAPDIHPQPEGP